MPVTDPVDSAFAVFPPSLTGGDLETARRWLTWSSLETQRQTLAAAALAAIFTIASRLLSVSLHSSTANTMVDTISGLIGVLAAFVFVERLLFTRQRLNLLIALSLGTVSTANLLLAAAPSLISPHPLPRYIQLTAALLLAGAAIALTRHSTRAKDGLERSLAAGVAVLAIAHFDYFLVPSMRLDRLYAGDVLKLCAFLLILYGCVVEFRMLQRELARRVAVGERRRMARDMHDGLAQELAFIASHSQRLRHTGEDAATVAHLRSAAERALHDSRTTIAVLTAPEDAPLDQLILRTVETFRSRFGVDVELELKHDVIVTDEGRNALLRILHEALVNAVRHGAAKHVLVRLSANAQARTTLSIVDDGSGFDVPAAVSAGRGLGLTSMQERASILGGSLRIVSTPGEGTRVEVELS